MSDLSKKLSSLYGMSLGWHVSTEDDRHKYEINITSLNNRFALDGENITLEAAEILKEAIFFPLLKDGVFPLQNLEIEKQNQIDDLEAEINNKTSYASSKAYEEAFKGEPAALKWCGTKEEIKAITPQSAVNAYYDILKTCNVEIVCSGGSNFSVAAEILGKAFNGTERTPEDYPDNSPSPVKEKTSYITERLNVEQSKLVMCYKIKAPNKASLAVASLMFGGIDSSKLFKNIRENMSLCYYCFSRCGFYKNYLTAEFGIDHENTEKVEKECEKQFRELADGKFTDEDLETAKLYLTNSLRTINDSVSGKLSWYLSRLIYRSDIDTPEMYAEYIKSVTRDDIISIASSGILDTVYVLTSDRKEEQE